MQCPQCGAEVQSADTSCSVCSASLIPEGEITDITSPIPPAQDSQKIALTPSPAAPPRHVENKRMKVVYALLTLVLLTALITATATYLKASGSTRLTHSDPTPGMTAFSSTTSTAAPASSATPASTTTTPVSTTTAGAPTTATSSPAPTGAPATATSSPAPTSGSSGFAVINAIMTASPSNFDGNCAASTDIVFTETFTVNTAPVHQANQITFHWLRSDGTREQDNYAVFHGSTTQMFQSDWSMPSSNAGTAFWAELVVTAPNSLVSNKANFIFHCTNPEIEPGLISNTDSPAVYDCSQSSVTVTFTGQVGLFDNPADDPAGVTYSYTWTSRDSNYGITSPSPVTVYMPPGTLTSTVSISFTVKKSDSNHIYGEAFSVYSNSALVISWEAYFPVNC